MIVAGTGHRLHRLQGHEADVQIRTLEYLLAAKPSEVVSGMADGFDMYLALAALELDISLTCAVPFNGHGSKVSQGVYDFILAHASRVMQVSGDPYRGPWQYQIRDEWMVDYSDRLVTCWDGTAKGGTYNTIRYARKVGRMMDAVWGRDPNELS